MRLACFLLVPLLAFGGCITNRTVYSNHTDANGNVVEPAASVVAPTAEGIQAPVAIIEFGDQGNAKEKSQVEAAKRLIRSVPKPLLVVFVHGWHNNARTYESSDEKNRSQFKMLLNQLAGSTYLTKEHGYQVIGVYIAWRGKQTNFVPWEYAGTFWNRYDTAARLGSGVDCQAAISDVVQAARERNRRDARTFLIGHSFGGLLLQQAVAQSVNSAKKEGSAFAPADLTLFLNPASESEITREMIERLRDNVQVRGNARQAPVFVSLTSESDWATGSLFPIGKTLASSGKLFDEFPTKSGKKVSGRYFFTHTPGHNVYLRSHTTGQPTENVRAQYATAFEENLRTPISPERPSFKTYDEKTKQWMQWNLEPVISEPTAYWIIRVDKRIMNGHGDIFNPNSVAMMAAIYRLNHQLAAATGPVRLERTRDTERRPSLPSAVAIQSATAAAVRTKPTEASPDKAKVDAPPATTPASSRPASAPAPAPRASDAPPPAPAPTRPSSEPGGSAPKARR